MRDGDKVPDLTGIDDDDLRMLYQAYSSQIEFSKGQVWRVGYYSILILSAIVALSKNSPFQDEWKDIAFPILIVLALLATSFSSWYIQRNQRSMRTARRNLKLVYGHLSVKDSGIVDFAHNYETAWYDWIFWLPLTFAVWVGFLFVLLYLLKEGGNTMSWDQVSSMLGSLSVQAFATIVLAVFTFALWRSTKRYANATERMADATDRSTQTMLLGYAERLRDYYDPKSDPSKFHAGLFTIGSVFQDELDDKYISPNLQQEFKKNQLPLSDNAFAEIRTENAAWSITDGDRKYMIDIDKQKDNLSVAIDIEEIKQKSKLFYGIVLRQWLENREKSFPHDDIE